MLWAPGWVDSLSDTGHWFYWVQGVLGRISGGVLHTEFITAGGPLGSGRPCDWFFKADVYRYRLDVFLLGFQDGPFVGGRALWGTPRRPAAALDLESYRAGVRKCSL